MKFRVGDKVKISQITSNGKTMEEEELEEFLDGNSGLSEVYFGDIKGNILKVLDENTSHPMYRVKFDNGYDTMWGFSPEELELVFETNLFVRYCNEVKNG